MKIDLELLAKLKPCTKHRVRFEKWLGTRTHVDLTNVNIASARAFRLNVDWLLTELCRDGDLTSLTGLTELERLDLPNAPVSDLTPLAELTQLEWLFLHGTSASDLTPLAGLTELRELYLGRTQVRDLTPLVGLIKLQWLDLAGTRVPASQVEMLQQALPALQIRY